MIYLNATITFISKHLFADGLAEAVVLKSDLGMVKGSCSSTGYWIVQLFIKQFFFTSQNLIRSKQRKGNLKKSLESPHSKAWTFRNDCGIVLAMEVIV